MTPNHGNTTSVIDTHSTLFFFRSEKIMAIVGQAAPDFSMESVDGGSFKTVKLGDYRG